MPALNDLAYGPSRSWPQSRVPRAFVFPIPFPSYPFFLWLFLFIDLSINAFAARSRLSLRPCPCPSPGLVQSESRLSVTELVKRLWCAYRDEPGRAISCLGMDRVEDGAHVVEQ